MACGWEAEVKRVSSPPSLLDPKHLPCETSQWLAGHLNLRLFTRAVLVSGRV